MCDYNQELVAPPIPRPGGAIFRASPSRTIMNEPEDPPRQPSIRRGGLLLRDDSYESNNDLNVYDFESDNDGNDLAGSFSRALPHHPIPVLNGGVLLRREMRERQNLTQDEAKSWDLFNQAKRMDGTVSESQSSDERRSSEPTRRKRKRRTQVAEAVVPDPALFETTSTAREANGSTTRIGTLISQIKLTSSSKGASRRHETSNSVSATSSNDEYPFQSLPSSRGSACQSPEVFSPPIELQLADSKDSPTDIEQDNMSVVEVSTRKKVCLEQTKPETRVLTLDQKTQIQRIVRGRLRPLYNPIEGPKTDFSSTVITSEEEFIKLNKRISRRVYERVLSTEESSFEALFTSTTGALDVLGNNRLQILVDDYVNSTLGQ